MWRLIDLLPESVFFTALRREDVGGARGETAPEARADDKKGVARPPAASPPPLFNSES